MWKSVEGSNGKYLVSNLGRVKSLKCRKCKLLKQSKSPIGYMRVCLSFDDGVVYKYVHRLVADAFIPNPKGLPQVNHINEDKTDNTVENLEWTTQMDNLKYGTRNQRSVETRLYNMSHPKQYYNAKISELKKKIKVTKLRMTNYICKLENQIDKYQMELEAVVNPPAKIQCDESVELCY